MSIVDEITERVKQAIEESQLSPEEITQELMAKHFDETMREMHKKVMECFDRDSVVLVSFVVGTDKKLVALATAGSKELKELEGLKQLDRVLEVLSEAITEYKKEIN